MNTYLIVSETNYYIEETLKKLKDGINNIINFNMDENTMDEVLTEASYFSMFDDKKCIIVKKTKLFSTIKGENQNNKKDSEKLLKYLEHENPNTRLIFVTNEKVDGKKKIFNVLHEHDNVYTFTSKTKTEMKNELKKYVEKYNYSIEDNSLWYIINNTLGNFDLCINELDKIMLYYSKPCFIRHEDVTSLVCKNITENNFKLVDSIINRDLGLSLNYLQDLQTLKVDPSIILSLLYREFKLMLQTIIYKENKCNESDIIKNLGLAAWQYDKVKNNLRMFNKREIEDEIKNLSDLDYKYKSGLINKDIILISYIVNMCL